MSETQYKIQNEACRLVVCDTTHRYKSYIRLCTQQFPLKAHIHSYTTTWSHIPAQNLKSLHKTLCSVGQCAGHVASADCGWRKHSTVMESSSMFVGPHFANVRQWVTT